jgi:hypothetical protein
MFRYLIAIQQRKPDVEDADIRLPGEGLVDAGLSVFGDLHLVAP